MMLFTLGLLGIWNLIDLLVLMYGTFTDSDCNLLGPKSYFLITVITLLLLVCIALIAYLFMYEGVNFNAFKSFNI